MTELHTDRFAKFSPFLLPLSDQLDTLALLNDFIEKGVRAPKSWFRSLDTTSKHIQTVEDLECYIVILQTLEDTWRFSRKLVKLTHFATWDNDLRVNAAHLCLDPTGTIYEPGIHRIRINLASYWQPENSQSVASIRREATSNKQKLAGVEIIQACVLQDPRLIQSMDGINLPFCNLAGLQYSVDGNTDIVPRFSLEYKNSVDPEVVFSKQHSSTINPGYAAPSLRY